MAEEILDVATVVDRDTVRIRTVKNPEGKLYELVNLIEFGPYEMTKITTLHSRAQELLRSGNKLRPAQERELDKALGDILKLIVVGLEPAVLKETVRTVRATIIAAWAIRNAPAAPPSAGGDEGEAQRRPTGPSSSRSSSRSTAATRSGGSTHRSGSSRRTSGRSRG
jgi:hypothetical protein